MRYNSRYADHTDGTMILAFGSCGGRARFVLYYDGTLKISGTGRVSDCSQLRGNQDIFDVIIENGITALCPHIFSGCSNIRTVTLPESLQAIGSWAFYSCINLRSIRIPGNNTFIGECAFRNCARLTNVVLEEGVTSIDHVAFASCGALKKLTLPDSIKTLGYAVFTHCKKLRFINIPKDLEHCKTIRYFDEEDRERSASGPFCGSSIKLLSAPTRFPPFPSSTFEGLPSRARIMRA